MNVVDAFCYQCRLNPFGTALGAADNSLHSVKYTQLRSWIDGAAALALKVGLAPGRVAAVAVSDIASHATLAMGLARIGVASVPVNATGIPDFPKIDLLFHDGQILAGHSGVTVLVDANALQVEAPPAYRYRTDDDDLCRIFPSKDVSGKTSVVPLTHRLLAARAQQFQYVAGRLSLRASRILCGFDVDSWQGFTCVMHALSSGRAVYFPAEDPATSLQSLELFQIDGVYTSAAELEAMLSFFEANSKLECSLQFIACEGSLSADVIERVRRRICRHLFCVYGTAETGLISSGPAELSASLPGAVGFLCPGVDAQILNGQLVVRSPYVPHVHFGSQPTSPPRFRDGVFYSGYAAEISEEGILMIPGMSG